jgi:hypothetical protein
MAEPHQLTTGQQTMLRVKFNGLGNGVGGELDPVPYNGLGFKDRYEQLQKAALDNNFKGNDYFTQKQIDDFKVRALGLDAVQFAKDVRGMIQQEHLTPDGKLSKPANNTPLKQGLDDAIGNLIKRTLPNTNKLINKP